ncbi:MAG: ABC transporter permease [Spirochaetota bacterium]
MNSSDQSAESAHPAPAAAEVHKESKLPHIQPAEVQKPPLWARLYAVWYRHVRVYARNIISNGLPPFLEPLVFLVGIGMGLGAYLTKMEGVPFLEYLDTCLLMTTAMFTSAFECSFGTFIRLEYEKAYDGMLAAPITVWDLLIGEILWAGTKGFFFTLAVLIVIYGFGILPIGLSLIAPIIGFFTGAMFAALSLLVTSFVKNINHFNFYFSGFISPMFFFAGVVFPVTNLPAIVRPISEALPLTHAVRLTRAFSFPGEVPFLWADVIYILIFTLLIGILGVRRLKRRLID